MTDSSAANNAPKKRGRPFEPGRPGGPGRPAGSRNKATLALDAIAESAAPAVLAKIAEAAEAGDMRAADILMSRVWPIRKGRPVTLQLPAIKSAADIVSALGVVADSVASGNITPDEGSAVASVIEIKRRAIETLELETRIAALEKGAKS